MKQDRLKKKPNPKSGSEIRQEYDFSRGERGKYAKRYSPGVNVVVIDPDVAKVFPTAAAVNDSLRALAGIIRKNQKNLTTK